MINGFGSGPPGLTQPLLKAEPAESLTASVVLVGFVLPASAFQSFGAARRSLGEGG